MTEDTFDYETVSPGIREVVRWLRAHDFDAYDGGDPTDDDSEWEVPFVAIQVHPREVMAEADRLYHLVYAHDKKVFGKTVDHEGDTWACGLSISAVYDPSDSTGHLDLTGPALITGWKAKVYS